jgi:hypothetical protein
MAQLTTNMKLRKPEATDLEVVEIDVSNNFSIIDSRIGFVVCTSTSRPSEPFEGLKIIETDTGLPYIYLNSIGWWLMGIIPSTTVAAAKGYRTSTTNTTNMDYDSSTETLIPGLNTTFTSEVGRRYAVEVNLCDMNLEYAIDPFFAPSQPQVYVNLRWAIGSSVNTSSTLFNSRPYFVSNVNGAEYFFGVFVPNVSGNVTIGVGIGFTQGLRIQLLHSEGVGAMNDSVIVRDVGPSSW